MLTALLGGALLDFIGLAGWLLWAFGGSLQLLIDQFRFRTGQSTVAVGWVAMSRGQRTDLVLVRIGHASNWGWAASCWRCVTGGSWRWSSLP